jgi:hypothetical protein
MSDPTPHEIAQILARLTVLERVVGVIVRENLVRSGQTPQDVLAFAALVKKFFEGRTPEGATDSQLNEAVDRFFTAVASEVGSQENR